MRSKSIHILLVASVLALSLSWIGGQPERSALSLNQVDGDVDGDDYDNKVDSMANDEDEANLGEEEAEKKESNKNEIEFSKTLILMNSTI